MLSTSSRGAVPSSTTRAPPQRRIIAAAPTKRNHGGGSSSFYNQPPRGQLVRSRVAPSPPRPNKPNNDGGDELRIAIDAEPSEAYTTITVDVPDSPGLLTTLTSTLHDMNLLVEKADFSPENGITFWVLDSSGGKVQAADDLENIAEYLGIVVRKLMRGSTKARPYTNNILGHKFGAPAGETEYVNRELLYKLLDSYLKNDVLSIQESIVHHVEFTLARSRYRFDNSEAYFAAAHSLRDRLIERWNDTQAWFRHKNPKRVYYLSMEFLMGRTFSNAAHNLDVQHQYEGALQVSLRSAQTHARTHARTDERMDDPHRTHRTPRTRALASPPSDAAQANLASG